MALWGKRDRVVALGGLLLLLAPVAGAAPAAGGAKSRDPLKGYDLAGRLHWIGQSAGPRPAVLVFLHPDCPISNQYLTELNRLAASWKERPIDIYGVVSDSRIHRDRAQRYAREYSIQFPVLFDQSGELATRLAPARVPEAFVVDEQGQVVYRGRIDDQWAEVGRRRTQVTRRDLSDAVEAVLAGRSVALAKTEAVGCVFEGNEKGRTATYARDIAPVIANNCQGCHRAGEVAPFPLTNYAEVSRKARTIQEVTARGQMPPWRAAAGFGHFLGERRLSQRELALLAEWANSKTPEGEAADLPAPLTFPTGWQLGEPDLVVRMPEAYTVPASGPDIFRYFVLPLDVPEDKVLVGFEFRPGNPRVCHHSVMFLDSSGQARKLDEKDPGPGYQGSLAPGFAATGMLGFWAPGYTPRLFPDGVGRRLRRQFGPPHWQPRRRPGDAALTPVSASPKPADSGKLDLVMQLHYHPSGKAESDQSSVGIYFAKKPVQRYVEELVIGTLNVNIAPGEKSHAVGASLVLPCDIEIFGVTPHMHLIGRDMKVTATRPDGRIEPILWIQDWDFNWQDQYQYARPVRLPKGTKIDLSASYDNSADNPANPNTPPKWIRFGIDTTDEMCLFVFHLMGDGSRENRMALQRAVADSFRKELTPQTMVSLMRLVGQDRLRTTLGGPAKDQPAAPPATVPTRQ